MPQPYTKYNKGPFHHDWYKDIPWYKEVVDACVDFIKGDCVDLGCGDGVACKLISEKGYKVIGIDNSERGLELARGLSPKATFVNIDLEITKILFRKFDYMISLNTIEHIDNYKNIKYIFDHSINKAGIIITDEKKKDICRSHYREFTYKDLKELFKEYRTEKVKLKTEVFTGIKIYKEQK